MPEAVRLLIWDLDETFWRGTLTEGGIQEIPASTVELVRTLNRRGIMNSICSKNDHERVMEVIASVGLADEFIFPSVNWSAKGVRVKGIIDKANLRPASVMFLDDNPGVRAEVAVIVPDVQIEDENFIGKILDDARFKGKPDLGLSRLNQYKVLESKIADQENASLSNEEFLCQSEIKVKIEYNLDDRLDRVVELINRTNQLNYTKVRLPENVSEAVAILREQIRAFHIQAGLISVADKYGNYGEVGFFMQSSVHDFNSDGRDRGRLIHFCFSCRTLGMLVEQWVYNYLGRPQLVTNGEVLTDLSVDRKIDWITLVDSLDDTSPSREGRFPKITLFGGCEANALAVYLQARTDVLDCYGNYRANGCFVRTASVVHALNMCANQPDDVAETAAALHLPPERLAGDLFADAAEGSVFVFNFSSQDSGDVGGAHFRHIGSGLTLTMEPPYLLGHKFLTDPKEDILRVVEENQADLVSSTAEAFDYLNSNFSLEDFEKDQLISMTARLINCVPIGSKIILMSDHDQYRSESDKIVHMHWFTDYADKLRRLSEEYDYCGFVSFSEVVEGEHEIQLHGNHYNREVYLRTANRIAEVAAGLSGRAAPDEGAARLSATG